MSAAMGAAASTFWGTVAVGAIAGAAGGFAAGATGAWLSGASFGDGLLAGFKGAAIGAITGAVMAGIGYGANKLFNKFFPGNAAGKAAQSPEQLDDGNYAGDACDECTARDAVDKSHGDLQTGDADETLMAQRNSGGTRPESQQPTTKVATPQQNAPNIAKARGQVQRLGNYLKDELETKVADGMSI